MAFPLIKVEGVSKKFCRSLKRSLWYGMQDLGGEIVGQSHARSDALRPDEFWAVKDVSFELKRGECLGLIGHNGAGKTTLLRMLNGLIKPDQGRIEIRGRVGALIALGAGFNPVLTGRENIYVNASVLGLSKAETTAKIDEIIDFAEIGEFVDSPVQSYSSGMQVRLGFAVATAINPDILLLDEVLAVGDLRFRAKCFNKISSIFRETAVIMVSHNTEDISRLCNCVNLMDHGKSVYFEDAVEGVRRYVEISSSEEKGRPLIVGGDFLGVRVTGISTDCRSIKGHSRGVSVCAEIKVKQLAEGLGLVWFLLDAEGRNICVSQPILLRADVNRAYSLRTELSGLRLCSGIYRLGANIVSMPRSDCRSIVMQGQQWRLLSSYRDLGQISWVSENLLLFGASVFMEAKSSLSEIS